MKQPERLVWTWPEPFRSMPVAPKHIGDVLKAQLRSAPTMPVPGHAK